MELWYKSKYKTKMHFTVAFGAFFLHHTILFLIIVHNCIHFWRIQFKSSRQVTSSPYNKMANRIKKSLELRGI